MGIIKDRRKFKIKVTQSNPTNSTGGIKIKNRTLAMDKKTIEENKKKKSNK